MGLAVKRRTDEEATTCFTRPTQVLPGSETKSPFPSSRGERAQPSTCSLALVHENNSRAHDYIPTGGPEGRGGASVHRHRDARSPDGPFKKAESEGRSRGFWGNNPENEGLRAFNDASVLLK